MPVCWIAVITDKYSSSMQNEPTLCWLVVSEGFGAEVLIGGVPYIQVARCMFFYFFIRDNVLRFFQT